jgi:hypothetical protein
MSYLNSTVMTFISLPAPPELELIKHRAPLRSCVNTTGATLARCSDKQSYLNIFARKALTRLMKTRFIWATDR